MHSGLAGAATAEQLPGLGVATGCNIDPHAPRCLRPEEGRSRGLDLLCRGHPCPAPTTVVDMWRYPRRPPSAPRTAASANRLVTVNYTGAPPRTTTTSTTPDDNERLLRTAHGRGRRPDRRLGRPRAPVLRRRGRNAPSDQHGPRLRQPASTPIAASRTSSRPEFERRYAKRPRCSRSKDLGFLHRAQSDDRATGVWAGQRGNPAAPPSARPASRIKPGLEP